MHVHVCVHVHVHVHVYVHACIHTCMCVHVHVHACMHVCVYFLFSFFNSCTIYARVQYARTVVLYARKCYDTVGVKSVLHNFIEPHGANSL